MNLPINSLNPSTHDFLLRPDSPLSDKPLSSGIGQQGPGQGVSFKGAGSGEVDFSSPSEKRAQQATTPTSDTSSGQNGDAGGLSAEIMSLLQKLIEMLNQMMGNDGTKGDKSSSGEDGLGAVSRKQAAMPQAPQAPQASSGPEASGAPASSGGAPVGQADASEGAGSTASVDSPPQGMPADLWKDCVNAGNKHGVDPFVLAAQAKQESQFGTNLKGASGGDGVMQVEAGTRADHAQDFRQKAGHDYDHASQADQVEMAAVIMSGLKGGEHEKLTGYNGGPNWKPGDVDSYQRPIKADEYATGVQQLAAQLKASVA
jgi:hypothetical protein